MPAQTVLAELPCPDCDGWMALAADGRWTCPACGAVGEDPAAAPDAPTPGQAAAPPDGAAPITFADAAGPRPPSPWRPPRRRFGMCVLYGILTLGLYFAWYQYQVPREVDERSGQRHHAGLYVGALGAAVVSAILDASGAGLDAAGLRDAADVQAAAEAHAAAVALAVAGAVLLVAYWAFEASHLRTALARAGSTRRPNVWALPLLAAAGAVAPFLDQGAATLLGVGTVLFGLLSFLVYHDSVEAYWAAASSS